MTRRQRLRRVAIICCHCLRNLAFYRVGRPGGGLVFKEHFWINVNNNFLDICVLEWCKVFGDKRGMHYWGKVISDPVSFYNGLLHTLKMTDAQFNIYTTEMRSYRDKFVAHLDSEEIMHIPTLTVTGKSISYLYDYLRAHEDEGNFFIDAPIKASAFYEDRMKEGKSIYGK
jgi:hypothetical protein